MTAPVLIGEAETAASVTSLVISTTGYGDTPAGSLVLILAASTATGTSWSGVSDGAANVWSAGPAWTAVTGSLAVFWCLTTVDLADGSNLTLSCSPANSSVKYALAIRASGVASSPLDLSGTGTSGTSTAPRYPASGTLTPASANEIVFGLLNVGNVSTITEDPNYATIANYQPIGIGQLHIAYQLLSSGPPNVDYAPSLGTSRAWGANLISFETAAASAVFPFAMNERMAILSI
ncbi:MAG: hypothetical protein ACRED8_09435 [Caulobacteraceae bacterium]